MKLTRRFALQHQKNGRRIRTWMGPACPLKPWSMAGYPDTMPQAIKLVDAEGRSCIYVPITQDGPFGDVVERLSV
jgi:hypothetical protein